MNFPNFLFAACDLPGHFAAHRRDFTFQVSKPRFLCVEIDNRPDTFIGELNLVLLQPMLFGLLRDEMPLCNFDLLFFGVSRQRDDLHAVTKCRLYRVEHITRRDEHHVRQIEGHTQVVIPECEVLFRIEHFEERRRRISAKVGADLIDFVHHKYRIIRSCLVNVLNDAAWHRSDVGAPMAADLGLVVYATQAHANKLPAQRPRDRFAQRRFPHARRPHKAKDRPARVLLQFPHGEVFDDPFLDLFKTVMILIQDGLCFFKIEIVFRRLGPGQRNHPVDVIAQRGGLRSVGMHAFEPSKLPLRLFGNFLRHFRLFNFLSILIDFFLDFVAFAKFLLNGFHLLAQVELALALVHLATSLSIDIVLDLEDLDFLRHQGMNTAQPLDGIDEFKHFLRLIDFQIEIRCDQIR